MVCCADNSRSGQFDYIAVSLEVVLSGGAPTPAGTSVFSKHRVANVKKKINLQISNNLHHAHEELTDA